jgi:hypothetical protein
MKRGIVQPKAVMIPPCPSSRSWWPRRRSEHLLHAGSRSCPAPSPAPTSRRLTAAYRKTIADKLNPALARLATFLEKEYIPACRTSTTGWAPAERRRVVQVRVSARPPRRPAQTGADPRDRPEGSRAHPGRVRSASARRWATPVRPPACRCGWRRSRSSSRSRPKRKSSTSTASSTRNC